MLHVSTVIYMLCTPTYSQKQAFRTSCEVNGTCKACSSFCNCCDSHSLKYTPNIHDITLIYSYLQSSVEDAETNQTNETLGSADRPGSLFQRIVWHAEVLDQEIVMMEDVSLAMEKTGLQNTDLNII